MHCALSMQQTLGALGGLVSGWFLAQRHAAAAMTPSSRKVFIEATRHLYPPLHDPNRVAPEQFRQSSTYAAIQEVSNTFIVPRA